MISFQTAVDIANRGLQHCGAKRIGTAGFNEISVGASECAFCYDKLRQAELQRNIWTFAIKRATLRAIDSNTMLLTPSLWAPGTTYSRGSIVADINNNPWISKIQNNLGNDPLLTNYWEPYFGPMAVPLYDTTGKTAYYAGELVYTTPGDGTYRVYQSLISSNSDVPGTATLWAATTTYFKSQVVTFNNVAYQSLIDVNTNNEPDLSPAAWVSSTTYSSTQRVCGSDGYIYQSLVNGNINNNPVADNGIHWTNTGVLCPWTTSFVGGTGSLNWLEIGGNEFTSGVALTTLNIVYPVGTGPSTQAETRNVYHLPSSFLRPAPQRKQATTWLGGPSGILYDDWTYENNLLVSADIGPILLRFVADITDVRRMHPLFCEGLAARIGLEVCEKVTQSTAKVGTIAKIYQQWISDARQVDAIEQGYIDPPDDDYLTVRY